MQMLFFASDHHLAISWQDGCDYMRLVFGVSKMSVERTSFAFKHSQQMSKLMFVASYIAPWETPNSLVCYTRQDNSLNIIHFLKTEYSTCASQWDKSVHNKALTRRMAITLQPLDLIIFSQTHLLTTTNICAWSNICQEILENNFNTYWILLFSDVACCWQFVGILTTVGCLKTSHCCTSTNSIFFNWMGFFR